MTPLSTMLRSVLRVCWATPVSPERHLVASSGLFDLSFYLINGGDVQAAGVDPIQHFCVHGWRENRRPNLFFDPHWYSSRYCKRVATGTNPLVHYIRQGERAGCRPIPFFDPAWYRVTYRLDDATSPLVHYLGHRRSQRVAPNALFDLPFYLSHHAAELGPNRDPFMHFLRNGAVGRDLDPSPTFSSAAYRRDVMAKDTRTWSGLIAHEMRVPLVHWLDASCPPQEA